MTPSSSERRSPSAGAIGACGAIDTCGATDGSSRCESAAAISSKNRRVLLSSSPRDARPRTMLVAGARSISKVVPEVGWECAVLENKAFYVRAWVENVRA